MAVIFLDSSALVRRYVPTEPGASAVQDVCSPGNENMLVVARLASVEIASAFNRHVRDGTTTADDMLRRWQLFQAHWVDQYQIVILTEEIFARAEELLFARALRAYDAMHIACAVAVSAQLSQLGLQFWTADQQQAQAATAEGLSVQLVR